MKVEQISIDDLCMSGVEYADLSVSGIYSKIDWLTLIFTDVSINYVFDFLTLLDDFSDEKKTVYETSGLYDKVVIVYNGIRLEVAKFYFYGLNDDETLFDHVCPQIRLDLSGSALDYLRSFGWDFYNIRSLCDDFHKHYHVTRVDWAFDFVNYKETFLDELIKHLEENKLPSGRVPLISTKGAIKYVLKTGSERTVYLGANKSDKLLRIYDKRLESVDPKSMVYVKNNPYCNPDSWYRIELQMRNQSAHGMVMPGINGECRTFEEVLKFIFEQYAFADGTVDGNNVKRTATGFWQDLFPWEEVRSRIIQNAKYVLPKSREQRIINSFESIMIRNTILYIHVCGWEGFLKAIKKYITFMSPLADTRRPQAYNTRMAFYSLLNECSRSLPCTNDGHGLWNNCGQLVFSPPTEDQLKEILDKLLSYNPWEYLV